MPNVKVDLDKKEAMLIATLIEYLREDSLGIKEYLLNDMNISDIFINKIYHKFRDLSDKANSSTTS